MLRLRVCICITGRLKILLSKKSCMVMYKTPERLREHYEYEKKLADRLRASSAAERPELYVRIYNDLFSHVPELGDEHGEESLRYAKQNYRLVKRFVKPSTVFLEIGAGSGELSRLIAPEVQQLLALEVSAETIARFVAPYNGKIILSKGVDIPVEPGAVDCAFSTQVLEHIHPDDALAHIQNVVRALKPGGVYICKTPHRFSGPHDVSQYFDLEATGLHLKEYTIVEIVELFRKGGLGRCELYMGGKGYYLPVPLSFALWVERLVGMIPLKLRQRVGRFFPVRALLGITIIGYKI